MKYAGCSCSWNRTCLSQGAGATPEAAVQNLCQALIDNSTAHRERVSDLFARYKQDPEETAKEDEKSLVDSIVDRAKESFTRLKGEAETDEEEDRRHLRDVMKYHVEPVVENDNASILRLKTEGV